MGTYIKSKFCNVSSFSAPSTWKHIKTQKLAPTSEQHSLMLVFNRHLPTGRRNYDLSKIYHRTFCEIPVPKNPSNISESKVPEVKG